jgi:hypothetical protein
LPAPKTLSSEDQEYCKTDIDQKANDQNPPLGGNA